MAKIITASILGIVALGATGLGRGEHGTVIPFPRESGETITLIQPFDLRNLLLSALGTGQVGSNQVRIPILAEGAAYEVIIAKPGLPKSVPASQMP